MEPDVFYFIDEMVEERLTDSVEASIGWLGGGPTTELMAWNKTLGLWQFPAISLEK